MLDERTLELIHAELDDELDPQARAELERRLETTADARKMRDELRRISASLGRMAEAEPPLALRAAVLARVRPVVRAKPAPARMLRQGWALAAGVVIGALGTLGVLGIETIRDEPTRLDPRMIAGTIANHAPGLTSMAAPALRIATPELQGSVALDAADQVRVLQFDLNSTAPVSVQANFATSDLRFLGFAPGEATATSLTTAPGSLVFVNRGAQSYALFFAPDAGGEIRLRFEASGRLLHEATLEIPPVAPGPDR